MPAPRPSKQLLQRLEKAKRDSFAQLLFRSARLVNERGVARVQKRGRFAMKMAHTALLPHIDFDGQRLSTLAERVGLSKQTVGPLVSDLERAGMVAVEPDPTDGRAKIARYTNEGAQMMLDGLSILREIERELEAELGARRADSLRASLRRLVDVLER